MRFYGSRAVRLVVLPALVTTGFICLSGDQRIFAQTKKPAAASRAKKDNADTDSKPVPRNAKNKRVATPEGIGTYTSRNFIVHTDMPAADAEDLLKRLETMLTLVSKYWGRPSQGTIEMYVVKELRNWPTGALDPEAVPFVETGGGLTITQVLSQGNAFRAKAIVYAVADRGTPQHEAVHAYCGQAFGRTGPVWYSEGMAEMGQYWQSDDSSVNAHDIVIRYLRSTDIKSLNEIVNGKEWTGDSWQNYAWRWALCHLLANNPNYASRFRPLGLGLLTKQDVSFEQTYGDMAKEISFEYREFINHLEPGFRVDLCGFDWKAKFKPVKTSTITTSKVDAGRGWQPSRLELIAGEEYEYSAAGTWTTAKDTKSVDASGADDGTGRLVGVTLKDEGGEYSLGEPFDLGTYGSFTAPESGNLYLRCQDKWTKIPDNKGSMTVKLKLKSKGAPLPLPKDEPGKKGTSGRETPAEETDEKPDSK